LKAEIKSLLVELQFGPKALRCVPVSSLEGVNLVPSTGTASEHETALRQWYHGPSLLEMINTFKEPPRMFNRPLRASILAIHTETARGFEVTMAFPSLFSLLCPHIND
jgi:elongation factor 1 alpha-like protein